jgi:hypothetical protein
MQNAAYQLAIGFCLVLYAAASPPPLPTMAANAAEPADSNRLVDKLLVTRLTSRGRFVAGGGYYRESKLLGLASDHHV